MGEPDQTERVLLATQHLAAGRLDDAEIICDEILRAAPGFAPGLHLLAHVAVKRGQDTEAVALLERAVSFRPDDSALWTDLGFLYARVGRLDDAIPALTRAVELGPELAEAWIHLADARLMTGDARGAAEAYCWGVLLRPAEPAMYARIAGGCQAPDAIDAVFGRCVEVFGSATHVIPPTPQVWFNLAFAAQLRGSIDAAIAGYRQALTLQPGHLQARNNLGTALRDSGQVDAAIECFRAAAEDQPDGGICHSNLLYLTHFQQGVDPVQLRAEHEKWNDCHAAALLPSEQKQVNHRSAEDRLRIGYVSPDFFEHPVGRFLLQLFAHHNHSQFEIFAYSSVRNADQITARLKNSTDHWIDVLELPDVDLAGRITADGIDILVDLTMHMRDHRLLCFARKPAPIQVTYLAYCSTTGLKAIDYRFTDPYLDPPADRERDDWYVERSVRLHKTYWCYEPGVATPAVNGLPAVSRGHVTFASLNNFSKVSQEALSAWVSILGATKNSRLLLHSHRGAHRRKVLAKFARQGIAAERIVFVDTMPLADYFKLYQMVDIALDTFPYAGGTTTCDALWMGIPVVSLAGQMATSRGGLSILSNVGIGELAVSSIDDYIAQGITLASDLLRLGTLRATLRQAMQNSPLMDGPGFARDVEAAYEGMVMERFGDKNAEGRAHARFQSEI